MCATGRCLSHIFWSLQQDSSKFKKLYQQQLNKQKRCDYLKYSTASQTWIRHVLRHDLLPWDIMKEGCWAKLQVGMLNSFFSKFEFRPLKFELNSNFVYILVEKLKQFAFDACTVGRDEGHSTHATRREASLSTVQSARTSSHVASIADWCLLCVWATKICHFDSLPGVQCKMKSNWTLWRYAWRAAKG